MHFPITGTLINVVTVVLGGALGVLLGNRLPEKMRQTVLQGLGLMTLIIGVSMAIGTRNILIPLFSMLIGGISGEALGIQQALDRLGERVENGITSRRRSSGGEPRQSTIAQGFVTASLLFCVGPMTVLGSIQDGLMGDFSLLAVKSLMDGFAGMALAASLGAGVMLSSVSVLVIQGGLSLLTLAFGGASGGVTAQTPWVIEMTATGGVVILSISFMLLDIQRIRAANLMPAILVAPILVMVLARLGISL